MKNLILLLQIVGLLLVWTIFSMLLVPCAIVVWMLKQIIRALEWVRDFGRQS